jgi:succinyl-diaminopimelate desuccinylase
MPVVPDGARQSTMNINSLHGGQAEPDPDFTGFPSACVPDEARMVIDRRYLIEEKAEEVREEIITLPARAGQGRAQGLPLRF